MLDAALFNRLHTIVGPSRPELGLSHILAFADKYRESYCRTEAPGPGSHLAIIQANCIRSIAAKCFREQSHRMQRPLCGGVTTAGICLIFGRRVSSRPGRHMRAAQHRALQPRAVERLRSEHSRRDHLTRAAVRPSLHFCPDAGHLATEPADAQRQTAPMSREGARIWRDTLASLGISPRESQIIESIVAFADDEASIASRLGISLSTVHRHLGRVYRKVGVANRWQLLARLLLAYIATRRTYVLRMLAEHSRPLALPRERPNRRTRASCIHTRRAPD